MDQTGNLWQGEGSQADLEPNTFRERLYLEDRPRLVVNRAPSIQPRVNLSNVLPNRLDTRVN